ncbi:MAG: SMC family ATPase [Treponema sp.]|nr:SMC family ATPase [Treponema sp.]
MRPLKLIITGFGPYKDKITIDMDKLGSEGLYLITGKTGSGKTSIFDAITFALYGEPSGTTRVSNLLRSKYAAAETPTEVELEFTYHANKYRIKRNPAYTRKSKRGEGFTEEPANATLFLPDGNIITKYNDVTNKITEILGIDKNQFCQITMLAQGDFQNLLLASTDDKKKIFRKIFKTEQYEIFQNKLKEETKKIEQNINDLKNTIQIFTKNINCSEDNIHYSFIQKAKQEYVITEDITLTLKKILKEEKEEYESLLNKKRELQTQIEDITKKITQTNELKNNLQELKKYKQELLEIENDFTKAEELYKTESNKTEDRQKIIEELAIIKNQLSEYTNLDQKNKELQICNETIFNLTKALNETKTKLEQLLKNNEELQKEHETIKNSPEKKQKLEFQIEKTSEHISMLNTLKNSVKEYNCLITEYEKQKQDYLVISKEEQTNLEIYNQKNQEFLSEQAGILAETLKENTPCPVCGSLTHPSPTKKSENAPSQKEVDIAKENWLKTQEKLSQQSELCSQKKGNIETKEKEIKLQLNSFQDLIFNNDLVSTLDSTIENYKTEFNKINNELKQITKDAERKEYIEQILPSKTEESENLKNNISKIETEIALENNKYIETKKNYTEIETKLSYKSKEEALNNTKLLENNLKNMEIMLKNAQKKLEDSTNKRTSINAKIEELEKIINLTKDIEINFDYTSIKNKYEQELNFIDKNIKEYYLRITTNESSLKELLNANETQKTFEYKYSWLKVLSDTANGTLIGKDKIMLETYIQMTYFDKIIRRANIKFFEMTNGQYELIRKKEQNGKQSQTGLDLDIIDHYTGTTRDVKTLSGGEQFIASLSLALGLSEEVQSSVGGIKLETMFVDEGFGTLDEDILKQAIKTLTSLSDKYRLIGLISHVQELKDKINKKILITKTPDSGSYAEICID